MMRDVLWSIALALVFGAQDIVPPPSPAAPANGPIPRCGFSFLIPAEVPLRLPRPPQAAYDPTTGAVTVALYRARGADLRMHATYVLSTPNLEPVPMTVEGPVSDAGALRRFDPPSSAEGEYWLLHATIPHPASFAVYYDEVWKGTDLDTNLPCNSSLRHLVVTVAGGAQLANERGPSGPLQFVPLRQPVSTETLAAVDVPRPSGLRGLDTQMIKRTVVRFRRAWFRPLRAADATTMLDTLRGFDVAVSTFSPDPASLENRYVIARREGTGDYVLQRFTWSTGDAVAISGETTVRGSPEGNDSQTLRLDSGFNTFATLHIRSRADGLMQIVDVTR